MRQCIFDSNIVLTASGTATLEAGIIGRPMVVVYETGFVTYQIARWLIALDKIALVKLVKKMKDNDWMLKNFSKLAPFLPKEYLNDLLSKLEF